MQNIPAISGISDTSKARLVYYRPGLTPPLAHGPADSAGYQPLDATLTALAAYNTNGFLVQTAPDTFVGRSFASSSDLAWTNPAGAAGNPSIALNFTVTAFAKTLLDDADAATARATLGANNATNLTTGTLPTAQMAAGTIVDSAHAVYTTNAALTTVIPIDDTIPQIGEGTQILTLAFTPKSITNKLRIRFDGEGSANATPDVLIAAMFINGGANAVRATYATIATANYAHNLCMTYEYVPGSTSSQTIAIRVGPALGAQARMNGNTGARFLGGTIASTLTVEEIKA